jgi:glutamine amidotransferase
VPWPQIGWNRLHGVVGAGNGDASGAVRLLDGVGEGAWLYFVHGYAPEGVPDEVVLARATHGRTFPAVAGRGRVMGTQFHPERSGAIGLRLLANFVAMAHGEGSGAGDRAAVAVTEAGEGSR